MPRLPIRGGRKPVHETVISRFSRGEEAGYIRAPLPGLRIPFINTLPNRKVRKRDNENRGKFSKFLSEKQREKDIHDGLRLSNSSYYATDFCFCCGAYSDEAFVQTPEYDIVCKKCAAVQPSEVFYEDAIHSTQKSSSAYKERTYLSERLRLFANLEPRIPREDIQLIGQVYSELDSRYCKAVNDEQEDQEERTKKLKRFGLDGWFISNPGDISKDFIKTLLTLIDKKLRPSIKGVTKSFKKKYLERWLQIKIFLCGEIYYKRNVSRLPPTELLDDMLLLACQITSIFKNKKEEARIFVDKKSVPNIDLMFLTILYNIDRDFLTEFGWYFMSQAVRDGVTRKDSAIQKDYEVLKKIFEYLNSGYKHRNPSSDQFICTLELGNWHLSDGGLKTLVELATTNI